MATKRLRFFKYLFTGAADWLAEQLYHRDRQKRHNQYVHGWGIAKGLNVVASDPLSLTLRIPAGLAIDPNGEELYLESEQQADLSSLVPTSGEITLYVALLYQESNTDEVLVTETGANEATRITEQAAVMLLTDPPGSPYVELARVRLSAGATAITNPADVNNPGVNEIDTRYARKMTGGAVDQYFRDALAGHKHTGASGQPTKVDLSSEVQGQLPGGSVSGKVPDSDAVDGIHASTSPEQGKLLALNGSGKFPANVVTQGEGSGLVADQVDGLHSSSTPSAGKLLPLDSEKKFPLSVLPDGIDAETLQGLSPAAFAAVNHRHPNATGSTDGFMSSADKQRLDGLEAIGALKVWSGYSAQSGAGVKTFTFAIPPGTFRQILSAHAWGGVYHDYGYSSFFVMTRCIVKSVSAGQVAIETYVPGSNSGTQYCSVSILGY